MKRRPSGLIFLDRDGVLNHMVMDRHHGTIDSPMSARQVKMIPRAAQAVRRFNRAGFGVVIVTNQPAARKGKTTRRHLDAVHHKIVHEIEKAGGTILGSYLCFHRAEDGCACRKPRTGLFRKAFRNHPSYPRRESWVIGDGVTDIQAGQKMKLRTVFLAKHKCETCQVALGKSLRPTFWAPDLWSAFPRICHASF